MKLQRVNIFFISLVLAILFVWILALTYITNSILLKSVNTESTIVNNVKELPDNTVFVCKEYNTAEVLAYNLTCNHTMTGNNSYGLYNVIRVSKKCNYIRIIDWYNPEIFYAEDTLVNYTATTTMVNTDCKEYKLVKK